MIRAVVAAAVAVAMVPGATASSGAKTIGTRGRVESISADGTRVAVHAVVGYDPGCDSGSIWQPSTGKIVRLADTPCGKLQSEDEYDELTLAGSHAVWTDYDFGNHAYCTGPYFATLTKPKPVNLDICPEQPESEDLYWEYKGSAGLLIARSYTRCVASCEPDYSRTYDDGVTIWSIGAGTAKKLVTPKDDTKLLDVDAGRILLRDPSGKLLVLDGAGKQVATIPIDVKSAWLDGATRVSTPSGTSLTTYDIASGRVVETCTMKEGATVHDVENGFAVYVAGGEVHLVTIATNADRAVLRQKGLVQADLEPGGLFYAYNVPGGSSKPGRVTFVPLK